tara:strand:+ start:147 stop:353 length:207 start_codon:yes stop_codon:yes gene_type:complete
MDKNYSNIEFKKYIVKFNEYSDIITNYYYNLLFSYKNIEYREDYIFENELKDFLDIENLIQEFSNLKI